VSAPATLPDGYVRLDRGRFSLIAEEGILAHLVAAGLDGARAWDDAVARAGATAAGRGSVGKIRLAGADRIVKRLRRGGLLRALWRDRHLGSRRLLDNLVVPVAARARGVPTPAVRALALAAGPPGLWRGWVALDAVEGEDLLASARRDPGGMPGRLERVLPVVRAAHDAGLRHPDLNLSNLLVAADGTVHLLDLDGASLAGRPLSSRRRMAELLRLERSWHRHAATSAPAGVDPGELLLAAYARGDDALRRRLERLRGAGRAWLALRGVSWPRRGERP